MLCGLNKLFRFKHRTRDNEPAEDVSQSFNFINDSLPSSVSSYLPSSSSSEDMPVYCGPNSGVNDPRDPYGSLQKKGKNSSLVKCVKKLETDVKIAQRRLIQKERKIKKLS